MVYIQPQKCHSMGLLPFKLWKTILLIYFFSSRFVSLPDGITDSSERWTLIRKKALKHATKAYYVADHSKFDHTSYNRLAGFDEIDQVITDTPLRQEWHDELKKVNCLLVDE